MKMLSLFLVAATAACCCTCYALGEDGYYKEVYPPVDLGSHEQPTSNHVFFALVQSFGREFNSSGNIAGIKVALDRINNDSSILPNHVLHYTLTDSKCDKSIALDALFRQLLSTDNIPKAAVIGCGCSVATEPTAEVSHYYNVTHISCSTASTELIDRSRFRRYFQLLQTMVDIADIYKGLIDHYEWKYVSLVVQNENLYTVVIDSLKKYLLLREIGYSEKLFESNTSIAGLRQPIDPNARIFIVASYVRHARAFLCEAYAQGVRYPSHLLILMGWYEGKWWLTEDKDLNCTLEQRQETLKQALTVHHFNFFIPDNKNTTSEISGLEFKEEEKSKILGPPMYNSSQFSPYCYDAVWTLAYALNKTLQDFNSSTIQYENIDFHNSVLRFVNESDFDGLTGPVNFNGEGIRATNSRQVFQLRNDSGESTLDIVQVGEVLARKSDGTFEFKHVRPEVMLWPDGFPRDGVANNSIVSIHIATTTVFVVLATVGIASTIVCLVFNFYFRGKKLIKLSSPNLNYLIGAGAIVLYVDIYLLVAPSTNLLATRVLCTLTPWLTAIGYSLCYGTIVVKMVRVHYIFSNPKPNTSNNTLEDWKLAVGVLVLVLIDVVILIAFTTVEASSGVKVSSTLNKEDPSRSQETFGIVEYHYILVCKSKSRNIFLGILYGYKAVLQVIALVLSFTTRKVKVKGLNDALYIAVAIYITSLLWAVVIVSTYSLAEYLNVFTMVISLGLLVGTTAIMLLLFVPKMVALYKDPDGETIFSTSGGVNSMNVWTVQGNSTITGKVAGETGTQEQSAEVGTLRKRVTELEAALAQLKEGSA